MTTRNSDIAAAIKARCSSSLSSSHIMKCERTLQIGFFFDGFARNLLEDIQKGRISNIGKLYMIHPDKKNDNGLISYRRAYLSGLGEDFNSDLTITANAVMDTFGGEASEVPKDIIQDQTTELYKDLLNWKAPWNRLASEIGDLVKNPLNAARTLKDAAIQSALEVIPDIRDSKFFTQLFKTGVNIRIDGAIDYLNTELNTIDKSEKPQLKRIEISVYGFDFGAILARDFLKRLISRSFKRKDGTLIYYGIELVISFVGLFDAVNRSSPYIFGLDETIPLISAVGDESSLPAETRQAMHLIAAHERRFYRRSQLLVSNNPNWREEIVPGISEDVGGGLLRNEQHTSTDLSIVSLRRIQQAAFRAGVPFPHLEDLSNLDVKIAKLFNFNDYVQGKNAHLLSKYYQQAAKDSIAQLNNLGLGKNSEFLGHTRLYIRWLAEKWRGYQQRLRELRAEEDRLLAHMPSNANSWFGIPTKQKYRQDRSAAITAELDALTSKYSWLDEVDKEARSIRNSLRAYGARAAGSYEKLQIWQVLLNNEWFNPNPWHLPNEVVLLFENFVHDQFTLNFIQRSLNSITGQNYFDIRSFDLVETS